MKKYMENSYHFYLFCIYASYLKTFKEEKQALFVCLMMEWIASTGIYFFMAITKMDSITTFSVDIYTIDGER